MFYFIIKPDLVLGLVFMIFLKKMKTFFHVLSLSLFLPFSPTLSFSIHSFICFRQIENSNNPKCQKMSICRGFLARFGCQAETSTQTLHTAHSNTAIRKEPGSAASENLFTNKHSKCRVKVTQAGIWIKWRSSTSIINQKVPILMIITLTVLLLQTF